MAPNRPDRLKGLKLAVTSSDSLYDPLTSTAIIQHPRLSPSKAEARLSTLETVIHEATHHMIRRSTGFPGLVAGFGPGQVGEGVAQVVAAAVLALKGKTPEERRWGERLFDCRGQTTRVGEVARRDVPLSATKQEMREAKLRWWDDMGGVHVHSCIVNNAHGQRARRLGVEPMAAITLEAMDALRRTTGLKGWARATERAAEDLHGKDSPAVSVVKDAWKNVGVIG